MIYVFEQGDYEDRHVAAVFEGPAGLELGLDAFLASLGLRPAPEWPQARIEAASRDMQAVLVEAYQADRRAWDEERVALLKANALYKREEAAHLEWLQQHPDLTAIEFELI